MSPFIIIIRFQNSKGVINETSKTMVNTVRKTTEKNVIKIAAQLFAIVVGFLITKITSILMIYINHTYCIIWDTQLSSLKEEAIKPLNATDIE